MNIEWMWFDSCIFINIKYGYVFIFEEFYFFKCIEIIVRNVKKFFGE